MGSKRPRIGVIGSTNMDLTTTVERMPVWGETVLARHFETSFGGKGANQAVAAAKLGAEVVMVTNLGDDGLGESALKNFESYGIDTGHVRRIPNQSTGTATILVDEKSGDNSILIVAGANGDLSAADVEAASEKLKLCDLILLQLEIQLETAYAALRFGWRNGVKTVLNPAPARRNLDMGAVRQASFLIPNETELAILTDMPVESEAEVAAAAQSLVSQGVETVIVTLGARGALIATREGARLSRPSRFSRSTPPGPATPSSAASPAISREACPSMRRSLRRPDIPRSRSPATARRNPIRPKPSSRRSQPRSAEGPPRLARAAPAL